MTKVPTFAGRSPLRRLSRMALASAAVLACLLAAAPQALAADEEDEDEPIETRIMKAILGVNDGDSIDYRERAPLVVPPSMNLVPPASGEVNHPAWPKDHDEEERKQRKALAKQRPLVDPEQEGRVLRPDQLEMSNVKRSASRPTNTAEPSHSAEHEGQRPLKPSELGYKGGLFDSLFKDTSKPETAEFTGEAPRTSLTAPPTGYMTPSAAHPYGLGAKKEAPKPYKLEDRGTGNN